MLHGIDPPSLVYVNLGQIPQSLSNNRLGEFPKLACKFIILREFAWILALCKGDEVLTTSV